MTLNRRDFLHYSAASAAVLAAPAVISRRAQAAREKELNILCWEGYNSADVLDPSRSAKGATIKAESLTNDPTMINRLRAGETNVWDLINVNNPWARKVMYPEGLIKPLDRAVFEPYFNEMLPAFKEELVIVSALDDSLVRTDEERPHSIIAFEHGCRYRQRLERWYESRGEMAVRTIELASYHAMLGCVVAGVGIALLPRSVLDTFPQRELLAIHELPPGENHAEIKLIWRKGAGSPKIEAMGQILHERALEDPSMT